MSRRGFMSLQEFQSKYKDAKVAPKVSFDIETNSVKPIQDAISSEIDIDFNNAIEEARKSETRIYNGRRVETIKVTNPIADEDEQLIRRTFDKMSHEGELPDQNKEVVVKIATAMQKAIVKDGSPAIAICFSMVLQMVAELQMLFSKEDVIRVFDLLVDVHIATCKMQNKPMPNFLDFKVEGEE